MNRPYQRLAKLELELTGSARTVTFIDVCEAALRKLSHNERGLVGEVMRHHSRAKAETHQAAWSHLQVAIADATRELRFSVADREMGFAGVIVEGHI